MITLKWFNKEGISGGTFLVNIKDGVTYTDNYNEELDSATVVLINQNKLNFEPFDMVELTIPELGTKTMLIDDFTESEMNLEEGIYQYIINLMSKTKELERVTLPSFSVTKAKNLEAKSLKNVIDDILSDYSPRFRINGTLSPIYRLSNDYSLSVKCPDMQMTRPTLKEALNRILSVDNSICLLNGNNEIEIMNLNERKNKIELNEYYNYKPENQSSGDYATETDNNYNNVVPIKINGVKNDSIYSEYKGFRAQSMLVNDSNAVLLTDNPIYDLKEVWACGIIKFEKAQNISSGMFLVDGDRNGNLEIDVEANVPTNKDYYFELNIANYILEEQEFNLLDYDTKLRRAFYTRGSNEIQGLLNYKKIIEVIILENFKNILHDAFINENRNNVLQGTFLNDLKNDTGLETITRIKVDGTVCDFDIDLPGSYFRKYYGFRIVYESQNENIRAKSSKYLPERNQNNVIIDNPGEAYVDIKRQGELFNQKANRLGNRVKYIQARFPSGYTLPQLGDYLNDLVLIRRELSFFDDYILFKGTLSENYVNINYFTGINARKRTWNIIGPGEAFDKELLDKWYCVLDTSSHYPDINLEFRNLYLAQILLNPFNYSQNHPIVEHTWLQNEYIPYSNVATIELDSTAYISGNSLIFNFKTDDNYSAGIYIFDAETTGGSAEGYARYVDSNGFADEFTLSLTKPYTYNDMPEIGYAYSSGTEIDNLIRLSWLKPLLDTRNIYERLDNIVIYRSTIINHKDSREKLGFNIQFEFVSDSPDIIIGRQFLERQQLINLNARQDTLNIYATNHKYKITDSEVIGDIELIGNQNNIFVDYDHNTQDEAPSMAVMFITNLSTATINNVKSIVITDTENKLIMAINVPNYPTIPNIYMTVRRNRDRRNYLNKDLKTWQ